MHRIAVGIGKDIKSSELEEIAGGPNRVVNAKSFSALENELAKIREITCSKYFLNCFLFYSFADKKNDLQAKQYPYMCVLNLSKCLPCTFSENDQILTSKKDTTQLRRIVIFFTTFDTLSIHFNSRIVPLVYSGISTNNFENRKPLNNFSEASLIWIIFTQVTSSRETIGIIVKK